MFLIVRARVHRVLVTASAVTSGHVRTLEQSAQKIFRFTWWPLNYFQVFLQIIWTRKIFLKLSSRTSEFSSCFYRIYPQFGSRCHVVSGVIVCDVWCSDLNPFILERFYSLFLFLWSAVVLWLNASCCPGPVSLSSICFSLIPDFTITSSFISLAVVSAL